MIFLLLPLLCYCLSLLQNQTCCRRLHLSTAKIHGRMAVSRNTNPPQVKSPEGSSSAGWDPRKQRIDDQVDIEEIGVKPLSWSQSLIHSAYGSAESIATAPDLDLEDEQSRMMLASPLKIREREENEGQARAYHSERESLMIHSCRPDVSGKPDAECVQKREASAQRTQACDSRRESLMTSSCRDLEVSGKPDAGFSCHSESSQNTFSERDRSNESGNRFENSVHSVFRFADPTNVGKPLVDGNKQQSTRWRK